MNKIKLNLKFLALLACSFPSIFNILGGNRIEWETLGNNLDENNKAFYVQRFTITSDNPVDGFAFCELKRGMRPMEISDTLIEVLPGYYYVTSPRFQTMNPSDTIIVDILTNGALYNHLYWPDGMHLVKDGKAVTTSQERKRMTSYPFQWINPSNGKDYMIYGDSAYKINQKLITSYRTMPYNQIPTPKKISLGEKNLNVVRILNSPIEINTVSDPRIDYWKADITPYGIKISTNRTNPELVIEEVKRRIDRSSDQNGNVPEGMIESWSDYPYKGFMLDVARNFLSKENVKTIIDLISRYNLNTLHFHLGDDEGWRLEIPSLPELTLVGSRRGFTLTDDVPFLKGIYAGDGNPDSPTVANGYYTVDDFIEILKYAYSKGVTVIPEFDTPGHSRTAIRSMEWRAKTLGDSSLRLIEHGDTSKYSTAQDFHDNLMNPALDGPYKFWDIIMDDIVCIYRKANVPLVAINIGGDEVPEHAWEGSKSAVQLMNEKGMSHQRELQAYFVDRVSDIAAKKGVKIAGWQEMALNHPEQYDQKIVPLTAAVNSWTEAGEESIQMAKKGYNVVLSNVDYLYFDQHYTGHPEEPGMWWGGMVTEFTPLHATIDNLMPTDSILQNKIIGISAHIFSETVRDFGMVQRFLLPRILGLAERAQNSHSTLSDEEYFGMLTQEMEKWNEEGLQFFVRQPGIIIEESVVKMNEPYGFGEIRYTLDGSEPDRNSSLYVEPFKDNDSKEIRAKLFIGNSSSSTSILSKSLSSI